MSGADMAPGSASGSEDTEGAPGVEEDAPSAAAEDAAADEVIEAVIAADPEWSRGIIGDAPVAGWVPHLVRADPAAVLHVHLAERLRPWVISRMAEAHDAGFAVHVALPLGAIYNEEIIEALASLDANVHVIGNDVGESKAVLTCLCDEGVRLSGDVRRRVARISLEGSKLPGTSHQKGRRFEALLCFLLSQITDFRVVERNLRTDTEELDAVVQQLATQGRAWATLGAPFLLLEAKNWADVVPQKEVSVLRTKMMGRRGSVRIAFLVGANGFASDAMEQEMRFASDNLTIVFVGPDELEAWVDADDYDEELERIVRRAMLR